LKKNKITSWLSRSHDLGLSSRTIITLMLLSLVATVTEVFGIGMFLPIFQFIRFEGNIDSLISDSTLWKYLVDIFSYFGFKPEFISLLLISFSFFLSRQIFLYFSLVYDVSVKQLITQKIRNKIFNCYIEVETAYYDRYPVGNLVNIVTTEVSMAVSGIMAPLELVVLFIMILVYTVILSLLSWQMTLMSFVILIIASRVPKVWINKSAHTGRIIVKANNMVSEFLVGRLRSPRLVRLSGTETAEKKEFYQLTKKQRKNSVFASVLGIKTEIVIEPIVILLSLIFLYFSYTALGLQIEIIGLYLVIVLRVLPLTKSILSKWQRMQRLLGSIEIIENRINSMSKNIEKDLREKYVNRVEKSISFNNVSYKYPSNDNTTLKKINVVFNANEITAIVGTSGSGKSTLIDLLPRLRLPTRGVIEIDGVDINKFTLKSLRGLISYVPQSPQIFNGSVKDHILYGKANATDKEIENAILLAGAEKFIKTLPYGIDTNLGEDADKLSGGQAQRLDLARALVRNADVLILDEPTSNLDAESEYLFNKTLKKICKEKHTTIIIVSHRLASISDSDKIVVLNQGSVVDAGKHSYLLDQNSWYKKAWIAQK